MRRWRTAGPDDAIALRDLERAANLASLTHVFPPDRFPYPHEAVLDRWRRVLVDPARTTEVAEDGHGLAAFVSWDAATLHHLAVRPDRWGDGLGRDAVARCPATRLWCLAENTAARAFYARLGWHPTGASREAEWAPYPEELEHARD